MHNIMENMQLILICKTPIIINILGNLLLLAYLGIEGQDR